MFSLPGTSAWTCHAWLEDEAPDSEAINLNPAAETGGLPNLLRYAFGGTFADTTSDLRPQLLPFESGPGGTETPFRFTRRAGLADVGLVIEKSSDLGDWTAVDAADVDFLGETTEGDESWEARVPFDDDRIFLRLNELNPPTDL